MWKHNRIIRQAYNALINGNFKHSLIECYRKYSTAKERAYTSCVLKAVEDSADIYGIVNHNSNMFTFAYLVHANDTCLLGKLVVVTPHNEYVVYLPEFA